MQKPKVSIIKFAPLTIRKNYDDGTGEFALLQWSSRNGWPRITVFTENKDKTESFDYNKLITATFDYTGINMVVDALEAILPAAKETKTSFQCLNVKWENGVKTDKIYLQATITVGKDKEGVIYMAVVEEGKKKVKFDLTMGVFTKVLVNDQPVNDPGELSVRYTKGYIATAKRILNYQVIKDTMQKTPIIGAPSISKPVDNTTSATVNPDEVPF